jgi:hypothetical protein
MDTLVKLQHLYNANDDVNGGEVRSIQQYYHSIHKWESPKKSVEWRILSVKQDRR